MTKSKNKKSRKFSSKNIILIVTVVVLVVIAGLAYSVYQDVLDMAEGQEVVEEMHNDFYAIRSNATDYQNELYDQLTEQLNSEEVNSDSVKIEIAETVVKSYVADFYTWTNKQGSYDVGGLEYVYSSTLKNFNNYARDRFYNRLSYDIEEYGQENLLEVTSVETNGNYAPSSFIRNGEEMETFYVEAKWTYKESEVFDTSDYQTKGYFTIIMNENGRFEIVSYLEG